MQTQCGGKENCKDDKRCMTHELWAALNDAHLRVPALGDARAAGTAAGQAGEVAVLQDHRMHRCEKPEPAVGLEPGEAGITMKKPDLPRLLGDDAGRSARRGRR